MVFSSLNFIFIFLPLFLFAYYVTPAAFRNSTLFAGSILFYAAGVIKQPYALFLLMVLTYLNYVFGICLYQIHNPKKKKLFLTKVIFFDFLWLFLFKYSRHLSLPLGISFYTFQLTAYLFDIYYGRILPERDFVTFGTYISMFPKLISGPITPYEMLRRQLHSARRFLPENLAEGMKLFIRGLGLKAILANQFGSLWANVGTIGYESISTPLAWLGIYAYSFQIYFDFSGYSDMEVGLGAVFGFDFPENFRYPYCSASITEFWRRWHISLGAWFRDYLYIPLGGSHVKPVRWIFNIFLVWMATGFWHGAAWNFILWGLMYAVLLLIEKAWLLPYLKKHKIVGHLYVLFFVLIGFVLFDASSVADFWNCIVSMFGGGQIKPVTTENLYYLKSYAVIILTAVIGATPLPVRLYGRLQKKKGLKQTLDIAEILLLVMLLLLCVAFLVDGSFNPFLYFRF